MTSGIITLFICVVTTYMITARKMFLFSFPGSYKTAKPASSSVFFFNAIHKHRRLRHYCPCRRFFKRQIPRNIYIYIYTNRSTLGKNLHPRKCILYTNTQVLYKLIFIHMSTHTYMFMYIMSYVQTHKCKIYINTNFYIYLFLIIYKKNASTR